MPRISNAKLEETAETLAKLNEDGAQGRAKKIVREGLPTLNDNAKINERKKESAQFRAGVSLLWDRNRILEETGWSLQKFLTVERYVRDEDRRLTREVDPRMVFAEYKQQQLQAAAELEDLAELFRKSRQFAALVSAVKTRSDILEKIIKTGQELGVIKRAAREVNVNAKVDFRSMSVTELRVHLKQEVKEVQSLMDGPAPSKLAGTVLNRVLSPPKDVTVVEEDTETTTSKNSSKRVKKLA